MNRNLPLAVVFSILLSACGGGGGGTEPPPSDPLVGSWGGARVGANLENSFPAVVRTNQALAIRIDSTTLTMEGNNNFLLGEYFSTSVDGGSSFTSFPNQQPNGGLYNRSGNSVTFIPSGGGQITGQLDTSVNPYTLTLNFGAAGEVHGFKQLLVKH